MTEPTEQQEPTEPEEPVEAPQEPAEEEEEAGEGATPGDGDDPADGEQEPESSGQPEGKSQKEIEKGLAALEREAQRHASRVAAIMEEDAQHLVLCELCAPLIPGFRWPQVPEDQRAAVMLAIGFDPEPDYEEDDERQQCPKCKGLGMLRTGSKVQNQKALTCQFCSGMGWRGPPVQVLPRPVAAAVSPAPSNGPQPEAPLSPDREAAKRAAEALGFVVADARPQAAV